IWTAAGPAGVSVGLGAADGHGYLELATPDGNHDVWGTNNGVRAMQSVADGDLQLMARFLTTPSAKFQLQGFLFEQDADTWIRLDTYFDGVNLRAFGAVTQGGVSSARFNVVVPGASAPWLRATREDDDWTLEYSTDGESWTMAGGFTKSLQLGAAGLFSGNTGPAAGYTARVDYFESASDPLVNEDGDVTPV
ncbi:DUF1349 domain-containing protein, partial [uncultured Jannaschia sp.]|uniref:DUF1349 domain-containing protein n=1 Tax=uncultured Jannaschia sp. TaxID=293347 RepID=UPI002619B6A6